MGVLHSVPAQTYVLPEDYNEVLGEFRRHIATAGQVVTVGSQVQFEDLRSSLEFAASIGANVRSYVRDLTLTKDELQTALDAGVQVTAAPADGVILHEDFAIVWGYGGQTVFLGAWDSTDGRVGAVTVVPSGPLGDRLSLLADTLIGVAWQTNEAAQVGPNPFPPPPPVETSEEESTEESGEVDPPVTPAPVDVPPVVPPVETPPVEPPVVDVPPVEVPPVEPHIDPLTVV